MTFDTIIIAPCANPNSPAAQPATCGGDNGGDGGEDSRCTDPVFAAANPGICLSAPRLIVKPDYAIREVGKTIEYRAYLWANGEETEVTDSVTWDTSNNFFAAIGGDGHATALATGIVTVSATYGLLNGYAQLEIIAEGACATAGNTYVIVIDNSKSSSGPFSSMYSSRREFAKEQARRFLDNVDFNKDHAAIIAFNGSPTVMSEESEDVVVLKTAVTAIAATENTTNLKDALVAAAEMVVTGRRVIILFSDGENKEGDNPVDYALTLRSAATFIIGVGLRANDVGFRTMNRIANGGFFLNAIPANQANIQTYLSGLQSYLCSGNCVPDGDGFFGVGELNFDRFTLWDVIAGHVDLIGKNDGGPEEYDLDPGHGLYLDGCGSVVNANGDPDLGTIRTKDLIPVTVGHQLVLKVAIAGNKRQNRTPDITTISLINQAGVTVASLVCSVTEWEQSLDTDYTLNYTVGGGVTGVRIVIEQTSIATGGFGAFGNLWDNVRLTDHTAADAALFTDTFDNENLTFIPPGCGQGDTFPEYTGYCYSTGCLDAPIPAQVPDSEPLDDLEA